MNGARSGLVEPLQRLVPGSLLRDGLERIRRAHMGALVVLGDDPEVLEICTGGFFVDVEMTAQRLSELAKMDGAIVLRQDTTRIAWANVHLIPDPTQPTIETGTRHRTAERVARCADVAVVAVSEETGTITLYGGRERRELGDTDALVSRANYLLQLLEGFRLRYDDAERRLTLAEAANEVTVASVAEALQRAEMVVQVAAAISEVIEELGERGRFVELRLGELLVDVLRQRHVILLDYLDATPPLPLDSSRLKDALARIEELSTSDLLALEHFTSALAEGPLPSSLDDRRQSRGIRALARLTPLTADLAERLAARDARIEDLCAVPPAALAQELAIAEEEARAILVAASAVSAKAP